MRTPHPRRCSRAGWMEPGLYCKLSVLQYRQPDLYCKLSLPTAGCRNDTICKVPSAPTHPVTVRRPAGAGAAGMELCPSGQRRPAPLCGCPAALPALPWSPFPSGPPVPGVTARPVPVPVPSRPVPVPSPRLPVPGPADPRCRRLPPPRGL